MRIYILSTNNLFSRFSSVKLAPKFYGDCFTKHRRQWHSYGIYKPIDAHTKYPYARCRWAKMWWRSRTRACQSYSTLFRPFKTAEPARNAILIVQLRHNGGIVVDVPSLRNFVVIISLFRHIPGIVSPHSTNIGFLPTIIFKWVKLLSVS